MPNAADDGGLAPLADLERDSGSPIWFQIMRSLEYGISTGNWQQGDQLPSESQLCARYGVSRTSVREALLRLEQSGLISRQQGKRAVVETAQGPWSWTLPDEPSLLGGHRTGNRSAMTSKVLRGAVEELPPWAAAGFGDKHQGNGVVLERVRSVNKLVAVHVVNYLPKRLSGVLPSMRDERASLYAALEEVCKVRITRMHRTIEAVSADRQLSRLLQVEEGYPVVVVEAVAYDADGAPVDFSRASVRTDRLRVTVDSGHADEPPGQPKSWLRSIPT